VPLHLENGRWGFELKCGHHQLRDLKEACVLWTVKSHLNVHYKRAALMGRGHVDEPTSQRWRPKATKCIQSQKQSRTVDSALEWRHPTVSPTIQGPWQAFTFVRRSSLLCHTLNTCLSPLQVDGGLCNMRTFIWTWFFHCLAA
jgi:hypothetical protein